MISYEELSLVFDMENPLTLEYFELCNKDTDEPVYCENHHILPRCIWPEYDKCKWNKSRLIYKHHFRVHELLPFIMLCTKHQEQMTYAWNMMSKSKEGVVVDPALYVLLKQKHRDAMSARVSGEGNPMFGKKRPRELMEKLWKSNVGRIKSPEEIKKRSDKVRGENHPLFGKKHTDSAKAKMRVKATGRKLSAKNVEMLRNLNLGKVVSEETRRKMRAAQTLPPDNFLKYLKDNTTIEMIGEWFGRHSKTKFRCTTCGYEFDNVPYFLERRGGTCCNCVNETRIKYKRKLA